MIASGFCKPNIQASAVPAISSRNPVGIFLNIGDLPNQLIKMITSTTKATTGVSKDCSIGFMASNNNPSPDKQDKSTVLGITLRSTSPRNEPTIRIKASNRHHTRPICSANDASLVSLNTGINTRKVTVKIDGALGPEGNAVISVRPVFLAS
ncbi:hypothetical protein D3C76_1287600 [compost metagenome]